MQLRIKRVCSSNFTEGGRSACYTLPAAWCCVGLAEVVLWHRNVFRALQAVDDLITDWSRCTPVMNRVTAVREFDSYRAPTPSGSRTMGTPRAGETISTTFTGICCQPFSPGESDLNSRRVVTYAFSDLRRCAAC